jgi:hypothetical protein
MLEPLSICGKGIRDKLHYIDRPKFAQVQTSQWAKQRPARTDVF